MMRIFLFIAFFVTVAYAANDTRFERFVNFANGITSANQNLEGSGIQTGDAVCPTIEKAFQGLVECTCDIPINFPLSNSYVDASCVENVCAPGGNLCSDVLFGSKVTVGPVVAKSRLCIQNIRIFNLNLPNAKYCLNYRKFNRRRNRSIPKTCDATVNGQACATCIPCDKKGGVRFDCTNIVPDFKSIKCTEFRPYLGPGSKASSASIPSLL